MTNDAFDHRGAEDAPRRRSGWTIVIGGIVLALLLGVGAAGYMWVNAYMRDQQDADGPATARTPAQAQAGPQAEAPIEPMVTRFQSVMVMSEPNNLAMVLTSFGQGERPNIVGRVTNADGEWYRVQLPSGETGYVSANALAPASEAPAAAAPRAAQAPLEGGGPQQLTPGAEDDENKPPQQNAEGVLIETPIWLSRPSARDIARVYPRRALGRGREGRAVLACSVDGGGGITCSVESENPRGEGFGDAALELVPSFRMQQTLPDGRSVAGARVRIPVVFRLQQ